MDVRGTVIRLLPGRLERITVLRCKQDKKGEGKRDCANVDDSCTTDDQT